MIFVGNFCVFQDSFGAAQRASVNGHHLWNVPRRSDKAAEMTPNTGQAEHPSKAFLGEFHRSLIGKLA